MEGRPTPTIVEVSGDELRVVESMVPGMGPGEEPTALERRAYETGKTVILPGEGVTVGYETENTVVVTPGELRIEGFGPGLGIAVPSVYGDEEGDTGVIVSVRWNSLDAVAQHHVRPLEYLADHVATAVNNIRSRERLERARNDLATRKEMIEMYDSLLRHDLGNNLQVITGSSSALAAMVKDGDTAEYAETKHESLTVEFDPGTADYQVYAGDCPRLYRGAHPRDCRGWIRRRRDGRPPRDARGNLRPGHERPRQRRLRAGTRVRPRAYRILRGRRLCR